MAKTPTRHTAAPTPSSGANRTVSDSPAPQIGAEAPSTDREAAAKRALALRGNRRSANERVARLAYAKRPGWHQCWINDTPGNIQKYKEQGYDFRIDSVTQERISRVAGVSDAGGGLMTFLMELPEELYDDDCKALEAEMNAIDRQIRRGEIDGKKAEGELTVNKVEGV